MRNETISEDLLSIRSGFKQRRLVSINSRVIYEIGLGSHIDGQERLLTTLRKKLSVNHFKRFFLDNAGGTFGFKSSIDPLDFGLRESSGSAQSFQTVGPVTRRRFEILELGIYKINIEIYNLLDRVDAIVKYLLIS